MNDEPTTDNNEHETEGPRTWVGGFGRHRFRAQWEREPGHAWFHFQGPFAEDDPDGFGIPSAPDFGFEWKQGQGARTYGEYEKYMDDLRKKTERAARRTAEQARHYAHRATRRVRDTNWDALEHEVLAAVEKTRAEMEDALARIWRKWNKGRADFTSSIRLQNPQAQHVRIEYDKADDPFDEDFPAGSTGTSFSPPLTREERDIQRRALLEELHSGAISIEEAERRLNALG